MKLPYRPARPVPHGLQLCLAPHLGQVDRGRQMSPAQQTGQVRLAQSGVYRVNSHAALGPPPARGRAAVQQGPYVGSGLLFLVQRYPVLLKELSKLTTFYVDPRHTESVFANIS